jgi:hypothetical protein
MTIRRRTGPSLGPWLCTAQNNTERRGHNAYIIIIIIVTTNLCGSWPALKIFSSHPALVPLFSS